jgi:putative tryptophan/tyrosine transport system substrate-binding protein
MIGLSLADRKWPMRRRTFLALIGSVPFASPAPGQETDRVYRLGVLSQVDLSFNTIRGIVLPELARHGFVAGANLSVLYRSGPALELPHLARELLDHSPDVIFAVATLAARAMQRSTSAIPIVFFGGEDAISEGLAGTMSRPGANVTGVVILATSLDTKRIELLHEVIPNLRRIAILLFSRSPILNELEHEVRTAATNAGLDPIIALAAGRDDYVAAFQTFKERRAQALMIGANAQFFADTELLLSYARELALPTACEWAAMARQGCLIGYGPDRDMLYRAAARKLVQVLQGVAPSHIPIERPGFFEFTVNVQTARSLGIEVPVSILARADEVIE